MLVSTDTIFTSTKNPAATSAISADGRYVVFQTRANGNGTFLQVFLRDMFTGKIEKISVNNSGEYANTSTQAEKISADGRYVLFYSTASNLGKPFNTTRLYIRDRITNKTTMIPVKMTTGPEWNKTYFLRSALFTMIPSTKGALLEILTSEKLLPIDTDSEADCYLYDVAAQKITQRVSPKNAIAGSSSGCGISTDSRYYGYFLDSALTTYFVRDLKSGVTRSIPVNILSSLTLGFYDAGYLTGRALLYESTVNSLTDLYIKRW